MRSHQLALTIYEATASYPNRERFGLQSQTRRAATSVPTNIAEGAGRATGADYGRFLDIAAASANELEYQLILGRDLSYLDTTTAESLRREIREIRAMLTALTRQVTTEQR